MKSRRVLAALFLILAVLGGVGLARWRAPRETSIDYTALVALAQQGGVRAVHGDGDRFAVVSSTGEALGAVVDDHDARHALVERFAAAGVPLEFEGREPGPGARALGALASAAALAAVG